MEMNKRIDILSVMSAFEIEEHDRLQQDVWQAKSDLEFADKACESGIDSFHYCDEFKKILHNQKSKFSRFKQEMEMKYSGIEIAEKHSILNIETAFTD